MLVRKGLLFWNLRQMRNVIWVAGPAAVLYVVFAPGYLDPHSEWPPLFVLCHSIAMAVCLGRFRTEEFGFLYSRGFARDTLWGHAMLASAIGAVAVWLSASLVIGFRFRSFVQDLLESPYYPWIMEAQDARAPWLWLLLYAGALPFVHYSWIRGGNAAPGGNVGKALVAILVVITFFAYNVAYMGPPFSGYMQIIVTIGLGTAGMILAGSRLVHRWLEIRR